MYSSVPTTRLEEGKNTAYGHQVDYAVDLHHHSDRIIRQVSAWVHHDNGTKFFFEKYGMEQSLLNRLLRQERPVPEEEHREEVLQRAYEFAERLARDRAEARGEEFEPPSLIVGVSTRKSD